MALRERLKMRRHDEVYTCTILCNKDGIFSIIRRPFAIDSIRRITRCHLENASSSSGKPRVHVNLARHQFWKVSWFLNRPTKVVEDQYEQGQILDHVGRSHDE